MSVASDFFALMLHRHAFSWWFDGPEAACHHFALPLQLLAAG